MSDNKVTAEEAAKVLQAEKEKQDACAKELAEMLKKHGMELRVENRIVVVPTQKTE